MGNSSIKTHKEEPYALMKKKRRALESGTFPYKRPARIKPPSLKTLKKRMEFEFQDI